jgi:hypothetical protein
LLQPNSGTALAGLLAKKQRATVRAGFKVVWPQDFFKVQDSNVAWQRRLRERNRTDITR